MKRLAIIIIITALFLPAGLAAMSKRGPVYISHPVVSGVDGQVLVKALNQNLWEPIEEGSLLLPGDALRSGPGAHARIKFASGTIELYEKGEVKFPSLGDRERKKDIRELVLKSGSAFVDINLMGEGGTFRFRTENALGQARNAMFTVSFTAERTVINVYDGEAKVSQSLGAGSITSSLIPGTTLKLTDSAAKSRMLRFDPRSAVENYRKNISPVLDLATGLPAEGNALSNDSEYSNLGETKEHKDLDHGPGDKADIKKAAGGDQDDKTRDDADSGSVEAEGVPVLDRGAYQETVADGL